MILLLVGNVEGLPVTVIRLVLAKRGIGVGGREGRRVVLAALG